MHLITIVHTSNKLLNYELFMKGIVEILIIALFKNYKFKSNLVHEFITQFSYNIIRKCLLNK